MAPGDLNLKKSWHPGLMKNQQKVWEKEQEALAERKKIQERQEEIVKEKELAELRELQYAKTGKKVSDRVEWMYDTSGVSDGGKLVTDDAEEYLLGKKRVDDLILKKQSEPKEVSRGFDKVSSFSGGVMSQREEMSRSREDPMAKINQQRMKKMQEVALQKKMEEDRRHRSHRRREEDRHSDRHSDRHKHRHRSRREHDDRDPRDRDHRDRDKYRSRDHKSSGKDHSVDY